MFKVVVLDLILWTCHNKVVRIDCKLRPLSETPREEGVLSDGHGRGRDRTVHDGRSGTAKNLIRCGSQGDAVHTHDLALARISF